MGLGQSKLLAKRSNGKKLMVLFLYFYIYSAYARRHDSRIAKNDMNGDGYACGGLAWWLSCMHPNKGSRHPPIRDSLDLTQIMEIITIFLLDNILPAAISQNYNFYSRFLPPYL